MLREQGHTRPGVERPGHRTPTHHACANTTGRPRSMPGTEVRSPLDAVRKLVPQIRSCADEIEATRELPRPLFEALADAGLFHLALPRALGCPELDLPTYIQVIEEIGKADASTAWAVNQGAIFATYAARMPHEVARAIWIDTPRRQYWRRLCRSPRSPEYRWAGRVQDSPGRVAARDGTGWRLPAPRRAAAGAPALPRSHRRRSGSGALTSVRHRAAIGPRFRA